MTSEHPGMYIIKNAPPTGGHVFQATATTFELVQNIIGTNFLTKFHDDRTINMASREKCHAPMAAMFFHQPEPFSNSSKISLGQILIPLTKFHDDRTINVASRVLTRFYKSIIYSHIWKNAPPLVAMTNLLTKFHEDWKINVASRVLTRKNAPPPGSHVFQPTGIIFELIQDIIGVNLLTKFHEDRTINVASREKCPALGSHVFQANTNLLIQFHEDWTINVASRVLTRKTAPPPGGHVFSPIWTIFELVQDINETNVLTKFHDDWAKIVTLRVFTRNTAPPPGRYLHEDWASNVTSTVFELNVLTKFHEDQTINVASIVLTRQNVDDG
ncbi:hypothetical protein DPMN_068864 [Dreissena polymorpha]|uniref:Uncharacterized protein n=1 Tax=Dreissena polymorpha TaxID=45954 RepID=A0A9D3Z003_DREPO|nr:hypothetical protein DPMN_068864 [Dreissena polymorpha]